MRSKLWMSLKEIAPSISAPWCVVGDFNVVLHEHEVMGSMRRRRGCKNFHECITYYNVIDGGFNGPFYTWKRNALRERLDRALMNQEWALHFQDFGVVHLPTFNSNHCPLWLRAGDIFVSRNTKPFRFLAAWLNHNDFKPMVEDCWNQDVDWNVNVSNFTQSASIWNRDVFGFIQKRKKGLMNRLHGIHLSLSHGSNPFLEDLESKLWLEYETVLFESLWA